MGLAKTKTPSSIPILSIIGYSGSGKTTLLEKLIGALKQRGYRLAVVKHHHHTGLTFDQPGKDSYRFARAGADQVILAGPDQVTHARRFEREPTLEQVVAPIRGVDLIITEGYKHAHAPKIEVSQGELGTDLISPPGELVAVASDRRFEVDVPQFNRDDVEKLADFIEAAFL